MNLKMRVVFYAIMHCHPAKGTKVNWVLNHTSDLKGKHQDVITPKQPMLLNQPTT